jgi:pantothenate synthetase
VLTLREPSPDSRACVVLAAARLGATRLIDNLVVELDAAG